MVQNLLVACLKAAIILKLLFLFYLSPLYCSSEFQFEKKKLIFPMEGKETKRADVFTRGKKTFGKKKEKSWRRAQNWKFDSEWRKRVFRLAVSREDACGRPGRKFRQVPVTGWTALIRNALSSARILTSTGLFPFRSRCVNLG